MIKLADVLRPLQHLSMLDGGIAREVFVQVFKVNHHVAFTLMRYVLACYHHCLKSDFASSAAGLW